MKKKTKKKTVEVGSKKNRTSALNPKSRIKVIGFDVINDKLFYSRIQLTEDKKKKYVVLYHFAHSEPVILHESTMKKLVKSFQENLKTGGPLMQEVRQRESKSKIKV